MKRQTLSFGHGTHMSKRLTGSALSHGLRAQLDWKGRDGGSRETGEADCVYISRTGEGGTG